MILVFNFSILKLLSNLLGERCPRPLWRRSGLYQASIQVKSAKRASALVFQERLLISSHSKLAKKLSAIALS